MHGDFSRDTFDPTHNFTRVLQQQGRLVVDADANEQSAIVLAYLRQLGADLIGWHGGVGVSTPGGVPTAGPFKVTKDGDGKLSVAGGSYYVDGLYMTATPAEGPLKVTERGEVAKTARFVYLDVWERHVSPWEYSNFLDPALGGLDTATRTRLEWAVTVLRVPEDGKEFFKKLTDAGASQDALRGPAQMTFKDATPAAGTTPAVPAVLFESLDSRKLGETSLVPKLAAWTVASRDPGAKKDAPPVDPALDCDGVARGGFTGLENQLYRIEVHAGGKFDETNKNPTVTLKWSRDNGSIAYPFKDMTLAGTTCTVTLTANFRDDGRAVVKNNWVEVLAANASGGILLQVASVETTRAGIKLAFSTKGLSENGLAALAKMTKDVGLLRRWDHHTIEGAMIDGGIVLQFETKDDTAKLVVSKLLQLEDGLSVRLALPTADAEFRAGDYWLIPARAATGDVLWAHDPKNDGKAAWQPARYTEHHYAPLAIIDDVGNISDLRRNIKPSAS